MLDKFGETIYCSRCRREIENKKELHINRRGMVYCTKCYKMQEFRDYSNIESVALGHRTSFKLIQDE